MPFDFERAGSGWRGDWRTPWATLPRGTAFFIRWSVLAYLATLFLGLFGWKEPVFLLFGLSRAAFVHGALWQVATYAALHGGFLHLLLNMLTLFFLGPEVERALGERHFVSLYVLSAVVGGLGWMFFAWSPHSLCIGASGAIFGVLAAYATLFPRRQMTVLVFLFPVTMLAWQWAAVLGLVQFLAVTGGAAQNIAYAAHLFGGAAGFLYVWLLRKGRLGSWPPPFPRRAESLWRDAWGRTKAFFAPKGGKAKKSGSAEKAEIDRILEKITREGVGSLTQKERETLHRASENTD
jgi:membrane associated rhomboid family serine protease